MPPRIAEPIHVPPLYSAFRRAIENRWCVSIACLSCCAMHFRHELLMAMRMGVRSHDENSKMKVFPDGLLEISWSGGKEKDIFTVFDRWLDELWDSERFDDRLKSQLFLTKAEKFAHDLAGDIKSLQDDHPFWGFIDSVAPSGSYSSLEKIEYLKYQADIAIRDAKWLLLSGIETLSEKFETRRANHLKDRLQGFEAEHPDVGWQFRHSLRRRSANPSGIPFARRDRQREKREFLEKFGRLSDLDKLKTIARPDFEHRLEFIPVEMIPNIYNISNAAGRFTQEERRKLLDWIGQKSGLWSVVRRELQKPFLIQSDDDLG